MWCWVGSSLIQLDSRHTDPNATLPSRESFCSCRGVHRAVFPSRAETVPNHALAVPTARVPASSHRSKHASESTVCS